MKKKQSTNYGDYSDPRWQKKRLEVMERAGFKCRSCKTETETLNVHHINYTTGKKIWDYPDHELICLCNDCHEKQHETIKNFRMLLSFGDAETNELISSLVQALKETPFVPVHVYHQFIYTLNVHNKLFDLQISVSELSVENEEGE